MHTKVSRRFGGWRAAMERRPYQRARRPLSQYAVAQERDPPAWGAAILAAKTARETPGRKRLRSRRCRNVFAYNRPAPLILNSFHFGNSCLTDKFSSGIDILQMLANGRLLHAKQFRNLQLRQPNAFMCIPCLQPDGLVRLIDDNLVPGLLHLDLRVNSAGRLCFVHRVVPFLFVLTPKWYHFQPIYGTR
jgi:hypothetical protein